MILVSDNISLSPTQTRDALVIVEHMLDKEIYNNTSTIPFPYTLEDALTWLEDNDIFSEENGLDKNLAIRNEAGIIIGSIGMHYNYGLEADKTEFGYWLAKPWRNKGITTAVIKKFCELAKADYRLKMLEAHVFSFNFASQRVLLKEGFIEKGLIKNFCKKDGKKIGAVKFEKLL